MKQLWICSRCGEKGGTEESFDSHVCKGKRDINKMRPELLLRWINNEITEQEAWNLNDN